MIRITKLSILPLLLLSVINSSDSRNPWDTSNNEAPLILTMPRNETPSVSNLRSILENSRNLPHLAPESKKLLENLLKSSRGSNIEKKTRLLDIPNSTHERIQKIEETLLEPQKEVDSGILRNNKPQIIGNPEQYPFFSSLFQNNKKIEPFATDRTILTDPTKNDYSDKNTPKTPIDFTALVNE
jgi:hypothetical protein